MNKQPILSLSKDKGDFIVQPFKGSGKGGQNRNKVMSCCRITHPASGAVSECQEERSFHQNRKIAFERLLEKPEFKKWYKIKTARALGRFANLEEEVNREMRNIKVEVMQDGKWIEEGEER